VLEGVVTNVAAFGAFVDIGVHQDGLVHVSAMSRSFVSDPREVAKPGDVVKVKVLGVDAGRKRISLSLRLDDEPDSAGAPGRRGPASGGERAAGERGGPGSGGERGGGERGVAGRSGGRRADRGRDGGRDAGGARGGGKDAGGGRDAGGGAMADALRRAGLAGGPGDAADRRDRKGRR